MEKLCPKCSKTLPIEDFNKSSSSRTSRYYYCQGCQNKLYKIYYSKNKKKKHEYYLKNRKSILKKQGERRILNNDSLREYNHKYYLCNKERHISINKKYYETHKNEIRKYKNKWKRERYKKNIEFRLGEILRARLLAAIRNKSKMGSSVRDLGCSIDDFKNYIQKKFLDGMSWGNHGEWEIDHIRPLSKFNLTKRKEFLKACHFSNMQPLWKVDNQKKGNR